MSRFSGVPLLLAAWALAACEIGSDDPFVARAAGQVWTVDEAAALLAPDELEARDEVVRALADLWIDYTLLATAAAEDSTLAQVDVSAVVRPLVEDQLVKALRDSVIQFDTLTTAELRARYASEAPGSLARARHILLAWPSNATPAQRDSVRRAADELRRRIVEGGEDFAAVAQAHSQDVATAGRGGELGLIGRGQMVAPLEEAIFALEVGAVSQPVESPYGTHLVQTLERQAPAFDRFRVDMANRNAARAESLYIAGLEADLSPEIVDGAPATVRELAQNPRTTLGRFDEIRALLRYEGGEITRGEVLQYLQALPPDRRNLVARATDDATQAAVLRSLAQRELLVAEARGRGWEVRPEVRDELVRAAQRNLAGAARQLGLFPIPAEGQDRAAAIDAAVTNLLTNILSGAQREVTPLGAMSHVLRAQYPAEVSPEGVQQAVVRVEAIRSGAGTSTDSITGP